MIGCGKDLSDLLSTQHVGQFPNSVALSTLTGKKYKNGQPVDYISSVGYSDTVVTLTIDLRPFESTVSYSIDRSYKGIAYSGINYWGDVYVMFSLKNVGSKISIDGISFSDLVVKYDLIYIMGATKVCLKYFYLWVCIRY